MVHEARSIPGRMVVKREIRLKAKRNVKYVLEEVVPLQRIEKAERIRGVERSARGVYVPIVVHIKCMETVFCLGFRFCDASLLNGVKDAGELFV